MSPLIFYFVCSSFRKHNYLIFMHEFISNLRLKFLLQKVIQKLNKKKKEMKIFWLKLLLPLNLKLLQVLKTNQMSLQEYSQNPSQELNLQLLAVDPNQPL